MKTIHYVGLLTIWIINSFICYGGSFIIENDYPELRVIIGYEKGKIGGAISRATNNKGGEFEYSGKIILYFVPKNSSWEHSFMPKNIEPFLIANIEEYFEYAGGYSYIAALKTNEGTLEIILETDVVHCEQGEHCYIKKKRIQDFHGKVVSATLNGVELFREKSTR